MTNSTIIQPANDPQNTKPTTMITQYGIDHIANQNQSKLTVSIIKAALGTTKSSTDPGKNVVDNANGWHNPQSSGDPAKYQGEPQLYNQFIHCEEQDISLVTADNREQAQLSIQAHFPYDSHLSEPEYDVYEIGFYIENPDFPKDPSKGILFAITSWDNPIAHYSQHSEPVFVFDAVVAMDDGTKITFEKSESPQFTFNPRESLWDSTQNVPVNLPVASGTYTFMDRGTDKAGQLTGTGAFRTGSYSFDNGTKPFANMGVDSFAAGQNNIVDGDMSCAFGEDNKNIMDPDGGGNGNITHCFAFGQGNNIHQDLSVAIGINNTIKGGGGRSLALGESNTITHNATNAFAIGYQLTADAPAQCVIGKYNQSSSTDLFVIGNGTDDTKRSNALTLDTDGNMAVSGRCVIGEFNNSASTDLFVIGNGKDENSRSNAVTIDNSANLGINGGNITMVKLDGQESVFGTQGRIWSTGNIETETGDVFVNNGGPTIATEINDNKVTTVKSVKDFVNDTVHDAMPVGSIIMWSSETMPNDNWKICDGSTYGNITTPSLGSQFIVGASKEVSKAPSGLSIYTIKESGGSESVTLSAEESGMPAHSHTANSSVNGDHTHGTRASQITINNGGGWQWKSGDADRGWLNPNITTANSGNHSHTITVNNSASLAAAKAHENRPPYYALYYIMKVS